MIEKTMKDPVTEEDKLRQLSHELSERISVLDEQVRLKEEMLDQLNETISAITHGLKTPLTGVKLFSDILLSKAEDGETEATVKYLAVISAEAERASRMISNIADLQKMSSGTVEWRDEETDAVSLVAACARPFKRWCEAKGVDFNYSCNVEQLMMSLEVDRFSRLVAGLLANALRFTQTGTIKLRLELRNDRKQLCLAVSDSGPGISRGRLEEMFAFRENDFSKDIGLAFTRAVVEHYQGRCWAESVAGEGAAFFVELPLSGGR